MSPFGMVQLGPNTITGGDNGSGYSYEHTSLEGFAFTQMSGVGWYGDLGNFLVMPTTGELKTSAGAMANPDEGYRSRFRKDTEVAKAGYYSVVLDDYQIKTEATVAPHSGMLRFTFPENQQSRIQIDLARRVGGTSVWQEVEIIDDYTISGMMRCTPEGGGWGNGGGHADYTVYFYARFSKPLTDYGVWSADIPEGQSRKLEDISSPAYKQYAKNAKVVKGIKKYAGKHIGFFTNFATRQGENVLMKAGISFTSREGARKNLNAELKDWNFDQAYQRCEAAWNKALSCITVDCDDEVQKTIFYTALYHAFIDPRTFSDVDGSFTGADRKMHVSDGYVRRTIFSGWDVFRSEMPLLTLVRSDVVNDLICSMNGLAEESGRFYYPRWEFLNAYSGCMLGNPAVSVLADAYMKGIRGYDIEKAYTYARNTVERSGNGERGYAPGNTGISETLEYAYNEWCMAELARVLGKKQDETIYRKRSSSYCNIWDEGKQSFRPRNVQGEFMPWPKEGILHEGYGCIESNPLQQGWFVPHDVEGMVKLMGGRDTVISRLEDMFNKTPEHLLWNPYYNHANEPVHHVPFLFNRLGRPDLTQYWTRFICTHAYRDGVAGLVGNEDVGQMSAWFVLASMGIHPLCPGEPVMELTSPLFRKIDINLPDGKKFTIRTHGEGIYIRSMRLNGEPFQQWQLPFKKIQQGGALDIYY